MIKLLYFIAYASLAATYLAQYFGLNKQAVCIIAAAIYTALALIVVATI